MAESDYERLYENATELCHAGKYAEALVIFEQLAHDRPKSKHLLYSRGLCHAAKGELKQARELCTKLTLHSGSTAARLSAKLEEKIQEKEEELEKQRAKERREAEKEHRRAEQSSIGAEPAPKSNVLLVSVILLIIVAAAGAAAFLFLQRGSQIELKHDVSFYTASREVGDDTFLEVNTYCPVQSSQSYRVAMLLMPAKGAPAQAKELVNDCIGGSVVSAWDETKLKAQAALTLAGNLGEDLNGTPRYEMIRTAVFPRNDAVTGALDDRDPETFLPGEALLLDAVKRQCGNPDSEEDPNEAFRAVGVRSRILWWGGTGLAVDDDGKVSFVLLRFHPQTQTH